MDSSQNSNAEKSVINCETNLEPVLNKRKLPECCVDIDDSLSNKVLRLDESMEYFSKVIDDWIIEYRKCSADTSDHNITKIVSTVNEYNHIYGTNNIHNDNNYQQVVNNSTDIHPAVINGNILQPTLYCNSEHNLLYQGSAVNVPVLPPTYVQYQPPVMPNNCEYKMNANNNGYWGPLLRYGTYGIYKLYEGNLVLTKRNVTGNKRAFNDAVLKETLKHPLELPLRIKIPRQAMICTLQSHAKIRLNQVRKLEKDPFLHMTINYSGILEQLTNQCGTCPKYLFTKVSNIPEIEREYFTSFGPTKLTNNFLSLDCSRLIEIKPIYEFYACELLIGDIIISQGFALWKRRALETCARKAFKVLENRCCLIGSTRYWYHTDYLTACITDDLHTVTFLPPFLTDPTEPLYKKDEKINKSDPNENFDISNPKSITDFWLYAPTLLEKGTIKNIDPQLLLYQSAEFSQMNVSFEIDSCFDESFTCTVLLDKSSAVTVEGLGSLEQARQAASLVLIDKLIDTQPIVVLKETYHAQYNAIERDQTFVKNSFIVEGLLWSPNDISTFIPFENLSDILELESFCSTDPTRKVSSEEIVSDQTVLRHLFNMYAQSSLVRPIKVDSDNVTADLWHLIVEIARLSALLVLHNDDSCESVLICKQVPHKQLKAILFEKKEFGVFGLLSEGSLSDEYLSDLKCYGCMDGNSTDYVSEKSVPDEGTEQYSNEGIVNDIGSPLRDIINDITRELIPGLDF